jgi:hypothetical protein
VYNILPGIKSFQISLWIALDKIAELGIIEVYEVGLFSVPAPPFRFAASGGVFLLPSVEIAKAMDAAVWQCEPPLARLQFGSFQATFDATRPASGLTRIAVPGGQMLDAMLLGLEMPLHRPGDAETLLECYAHGMDLVTTYKESAGRPLRVDAVWRAIRPTPGESFLAAVDLIVSVRTDLLESWPGVVVQSILRGTKASRLRALDPPRSTPLTLPADGPLILEPADGPGCILWELPAAELSYAEMIHPADFHCDEAAREASAGGMTRLRHRLFPEALEKGVILRARVRGVFLSRQDDSRVAAACYAALAAAEPPLDVF